MGTLEPVSFRIRHLHRFFCAHFPICCLYSSLLLDKCSGSTVSISMYFRVRHVHQARVPRGKQPLLLWRFLRVGFSQKDCGHSVSVDLSAHGLTCLYDESALQSLCLMKRSWSYSMSYLSGLRKGRQTVSRWLFKCAILTQPDLLIRLCSFIMHRTCIISIHWLSNCIRRLWTVRWVQWQLYSAQWFVSTESV